MSSCFNDGNVEFKITFTTHCSANCVTCLNGKIRNHYELDIELYKKLINQIIDLKIDNYKTVSFYSIGESYLHPNFVDMCEWAIPKLHEVGISTMIVTNGANITTIPMGIDDFHISFNAGKKNSYEDITKLEFEKTYANIERLYHTGEFQKAKNIEFDMLCFDKNEGEEEDFLQLFNNYKIARYRFSYKYDNQHGETGQQGRLSRYSDARQRITCDYVSNIVCIYPNGDIIICSHDFFDEYIYGNLQDSSLVDILFGKKRLQVLKNHRMGIFDGICKKCDYNCVNSTISYRYGYFDLLREKLSKEDTDYLTQLQILGDDLASLIHGKKIMIVGSMGKRGRAFIEWVKNQKIQFLFKWDKKRGTSLESEIQHYAPDVIVASNWEIYLWINNKTKEMSQNIINLQLYCPFG